MRKFALAFSLAAALTVSAAPKHFEAKTDHYALTVEVEADRYRILVSDVANARTVLEAAFPAQPAVPMTASAKLPEGGDVRVHVRVQDPPALSATLQVMRDGILIDNVVVMWAMSPQASKPLNVSVLAAKYPDALRVGGDIKAPAVLERAEPWYSPEAREARVSGIVIIETVIGRDGQIKDAVVLKDIGYGLGQAALDAVRQWKFVPATRNGEPVDVIFNLTVNFKLN